MLRKKICKILSAIMIATSILGTNAQAVGATVNNEGTTIEMSAENVLEDGIYTITNQRLKSGQDSDSGIASYIDGQSTVVIKDGKITVTMKYNDEENIVRSTNHVKINGEAVDFIKNEDNSISFEVSSIDDLYSRIDISITYYNEYLVNMFPGGLHTVSFDLLHEGELTKVGSFEEESEENVLADGKYKASNITRYYTDSEHGNSSARNAIESETLIKVENGKTYLTITFSAMYSMLEDIKVSLDGVTLEVVEDANAKTITFEVPSADTEVLLGMNIKGMNHAVDFYVANDMTTLEKINEEADTPVEDDKEEVVPEAPETTPEDGNNDSSSETIGTKVYTIENEVSHESAIGQSMARQYLNSVSKVEEINGEYYITLTFTGIDYMNNHEIYVNGVKVAVEEVSKTSDQLALRFKVASLSDSIKVGTYVIPMGRNIEFGLTLLESTLTLVSEDVDTGNSNNSSNNNETSTDTNTNTNTSISETTNSTVEEESNVKETVTVKVYNVQNNVTHSSATGQAMARKYLNSLTEVKEINGKYYVTLTFTGVEFMNNHEIYVNGSKVSHTVVSDNGESLSLRFVIGSLEDSISVKTYVVPMGREVEFGVELLLDTLTLVNEYTIEADELPQTGAAASSAVALSVGMMAIASGTVIRRKRK